jgi:hypothetical protein
MELSKSAQQPETAVGRTLICIVWFGLAVRATLADGLENPRKSLRKYGLRASGHGHKSLKRGARSQSRKATQVAGNKR